MKLIVGKFKDKETQKINFVEIKIEVGSKTDKKKLRWDTLKPAINNLNKQYYTLSISGTIYDKDDCLINGGQINTGIVKFLQMGVIKLLIDKKDLVKILNIWEEYHLNDLQAGTNNQMEFLKNYESCHDWDYNKCCKLLKAVGLYEDRGYQYGSNWLLKPIPDNIIDYITELRIKYNK